MNNANIEIERKYVIAMPDTEQLSHLDGYTVSEIVQTYLPSEGGRTHRVRRRAYPDRVIYTETVKRRIDALSAFEEEREISEGEYLSILSRFAAESRSLRKHRHTFDYLGQTFEVDIYPEWISTCIMECELKEREAEPKAPPLIRVIREVTGDKRYTNASMARSFPPEIIGV